MTYPFHFQLIQKTYKMNSTTIIILITLIANVSVAKKTFSELEKAALDDKLKTFLEGLKPILQTENGSLGIPILDPFATEYQKINFSEDDISIHGNLRDALVEGLSEYTVNDAKFKLAGLKITLNITWPSIKIKSLYKLNAKFDEWEGFALFGKGDVRIQVTNFTFRVAAQLGIKSKKVFVKTLSTALSLEAIKFTASGIYNNQEASESINAIVSSSLPYALESYQPVFIENVDVRLKNFINSVLGELTLQDIINVIG